MKRLAATGRNRVEVLDYEHRPLGDDEVLVRTEIASGKHGTALAILESVNFRDARFDSEMRLFVQDAPDGTALSREKPWGVGTSGVGRVEAVGARVARWKPGDRVFGVMDIRETNILHQDWLWALGDLDPLTALCIEPAYVAFHSVRESNVRFGDKVVVVGLGAIGLMTVRMARESGAEQVIAVDPIEKRRELALRLGAHVALDPREGDAAVEIHRLTGSKGADVSIEVSGAYPGLHLAIRATRVAGTVCATGFYQGEANTLWLGREWHHNRLSMVVPHGCGGGHPPRDFPRWTEHRAYDAIVSMMWQGRLLAPGVIDPIVSIEEGPDVFDLIRNHPERVVKYAVRF